VDHPLLRRGLSCIDTPGVGGLEAGHTDITMATLSVADALLFVVDASAPLTAPELRFLVRATERIDTVIFVLTKIDAHPSWATILADDRALIAEHAPRYADAPFLPISNVVKAEADSAAEAGDEEFAANLRRESGFAALEEILIAKVLNRTQQLRVGNLLRLLSTVLAHMAQAQATRLRSARGDPQAEIALQEEQKRYQDLLATNARWRQDFHSGFQKLGMDIQLEITRMSTEEASRYSERIKETKSDQMESLPSELLATIEGRWMDLNHRLYEGVEQILTGVFVTEQMEIPVYDIPLPERLRSLPAPSLDDETPEQQGVAAKFSEVWPILGMATSANAMLSFLFGGPIGLVGMGAGLLVGRVITQQRQLQVTRVRTQRGAQQYVRESLALAGREMSAELQKQLVDMRRTLEEQVAERLLERKQEIEASVRQCQERMHAAETDRAREKAEAEELLQRIQQFGQRADQFRKYMASSTEPANP
jgi:hypothetical protein